MGTRNEVVKYLVKKYFKDDIAKAAEVSRFSRQQLSDWLFEKKTPQEANVDWLMHVAIAPEFQVIFEYAPIETSGAEASVRQQLAHLLEGREQASGIYAFYDSMANLIYIGKSDGNLLGECYTQLNRSIRDGIFPKGARQPEKRLDVVRYVSAYDVQASQFKDYAKHVESLILRISKPRLNSNIGHIERMANQ